MTDSDDAGHKLHQLIDGYRISQAIHVAARLGIADHLGEGARTSAQLAAATGTHADALRRLLRALAASGVLREEPEDSFALTRVGAALRRDAKDSRHAWAAFSGRPSVWGAWGALLHSVRTGENAFRHAHGTDVWDYRARDPAESAAFDQAMREGSLRAFAAVSACYDFGRYTRIADIGGGDGSFLAAILAAHPGCAGVLMDQPHVVAAAPAVLREAGVAARCEIVPGSFFAGVPEGCDAYLLKFILHDWEDAEALAVLRACRRAMPATGSLVIVERLLAPANEGLDGKLSDLNMLVSAGGRERSAAAFAALLAAAGFALRSVVPTGGPLAVIEGAPV